MFTDNIEIWNAKQTTTKIKFEMIQRQQRSDTGNMCYTIIVQFQV